MNVFQAAMGQCPLLRCLWDKIATGETKIPKKIRFGQNSQNIFFVFQRASTILHVRMWEGRNCLRAAPCCSSFASLDTVEIQKNAKNRFDAKKKLRKKS